MTNTDTYKKDIDGLRALAIILVVFFHMKVPGFSGGFVGVDLFFVISGFLISSILTKNIRNEKFSFSGFYIGRARRLAPSLLFVITCTWLIGFFLLDEQAFAELGHSINSTILFFSNWYFFSQSGYFDAELLTNPLLHSWSLSIEEQFYLIWPLLLFIAIKFCKLTRDKLVIALVIFTAIFFVMGIWLVDIEKQQNVFFNSFVRIWELSSGALIAASFHKIKISRRQGEILRGLGLACLLCSVAFYDHLTPFPGAASVLPVAAAALLLLACASPEGTVYTLLCIRPLSYIGSISYALYLWHWPVFVFSVLLYPEPSWLTTTILIISSTLLAALTTQYIERPVRFGLKFKNPTVLFASLGGSSIALLLLAVFTIFTHGIPSRWQYENINLDSVAYDFSEAFNLGTCFVDDSYSYKNVLTDECLGTSKDEFNVLVIGDSFAAHLMPGLKHHFPNIHFNQATASGCRALKNFANPDHYQNKWPCPHLNKILFESIVKNQGFDAFILVSDWQYGKNAEDGPKIVSTVDYLLSVNPAPVMVIGNSPVYKSATDIGLRRHQITNFRLTTPLKFRDNLLLMDQYNKTNINNAKFVSLLNSYCFDESCPIVTDDGNLVHFGTHLTEWGAIDIIATAKRDIARFFKQNKTIP